jgi:hypothetical protein
MTTAKPKTKKAYPKPTITANDIRHFVGDQEVASLPEMLARLSIEVDRKTSGYIYNTIHAQRETLLPTPSIYGTAYLYPVEELEAIVRKAHDTIGTKRQNNDKVKRLVEKLKTNPELAEVLLGLLD